MDCIEHHGYIQLGDSVLQSKAFQSLSASTRFVYLCLASAAKQKPTVQISHGNMKRFYGISGTTFDRAIAQLQEAGFVKIVLDEDRSQYVTNTYRFVSDWKTIR